MKPIAPARYKVEFTASAELRDKLERLRSLMRSSVPDGDLATIIEEAVTEKLERLEAKRFGKTRAPRKSLNLSGDREQEYFADGMTEALIANLAKIGSLKVISRASAIRYKGTDKSLPTDLWHLLCGYVLSPVRLSPPGSFWQEDLHKDIDADGVVIR